MRRKPGTLLPIELSILNAGMELLRRGEPVFHGYAVAREISDLDGARRLTGHGTLYRALERLETSGLLESQLENAEVAAGENRPRRRLYTLTAAGQREAVEAPSPAPARQAVNRPGLASR